MALLIKKEGLRKDDGSIIEIGQDPNDGILVRFMPQGEFKGFNQQYFLKYFTKLQFDNEGFGSINVIYDDATKDELTKIVTVEIASFQQIMDTYDANAAILPKQMHPMAIVAWSIHKQIADKLEKKLGKGTVKIELGLM